MAPTGQSWAVTTAWHVCVAIGDPGGRQQGPRQSPALARRLLQSCHDDSLNVALPLRMLEVFSSESTYLPALQDASCVVSVIEQILHYVVQNGYYRSLCLLINRRRQAAAHRRLPPRLLYSLAFNARFLRHLWSLVSSMTTRMITGCRRPSPLAVGVPGAAGPPDARPLQVITNLVKMLKARDTRRNFCPPNHWLSEQEDIRADKVRGPRPAAPGLPAAAGAWHLTPPCPLTAPEPALKKRVRVHLLNAHGLDEAGIDGGGVFREFLNELLKSGFNPNQGFFKTTHEGLLYPNPAAQMLVGDSFARHYYFLGRMLGKALYENMLVELPFAGFFLSKLLGTSADVDIHHLASLDPEVYRNLLFLKSYEGDVEELGLNFTVVNNDLGEAQVVELKAGGKDIPVTSANRIAYIHLVADYRLNRQIRAHCLAFRQGLANVVSLEWLRMFDQQEMQVLISGAQVPISLEDLKSFTSYSGTCPAPARRHWPAPRPRGGRRGPLLLSR
ncbi:PREDICTED: ubiquitin-protein ligase E3C [Condylura cristata]|uniref:ubiquitin-protein ligase E3C n=1 Tax=Condylura cristata TaxID=143302 RepID=UPI000643C597|nr:PREDICTED: ubiquitin-protein ligase E3C [Condylura cristata]